MAQKGSGVSGGKNMPHRRDAKRVVLHGVESVGKSVLVEKLAARFGTNFVPEYGRVYCEINGTDCSMDDLLLIGRTQQAMIEEAAPLANGVLFSDTDALMTAAWAEMIHGEIPPELMQAAKADLYLHLAADVPFREDGLRIYGDEERRQRFDAMARARLVEAGVSVVKIGGDWDEREAAAIAAVENLLGA